MKKNLKLGAGLKEGSTIKRWGLILFFAIVIFLAFQRSNIYYIKTIIENSGIFAPLIFIIVKIFLVVLAPMTAFPIFLFAGPLFGFTKGLIYLLIGDAIGSTIAFFLSRVYGTKFLYRILSEERRKSVFKLLSSVETWKGNILTRLIFPFQDLITYAAGLTKISFKSFIISNTIIKTISFILLVALGMALIEKTTFFIVFGVLLFIALIVVTYTFLSKRIKK